MALPQLIILAIILLLLILWGAVRLHRHLTRVKRRLNLLLDALDSADTSMRFPTDTDHEVNAALNRIAQNLSDLRSRVIETEKYYQSITDTVATGVLVIAPTGHIHLANPAALRLLDRPAITHISSLRPSWPELYALLHTPSPGLDTTVRNLAVKTTSFTTHKGDTLLIATLDDISSQLATANLETWKEMSRILTHEIMNGIAPVVSIADTLKLRYDGHEDYMTHGLDAISDSTRSLKNFVANYKRLTVLPPPEPTDFDLTPLLQTAIDLTTSRPICNDYNNPNPDTTQNRHAGPPKFTLTLPESPARVHADRSQVLQVLINLIKNAIEANATVIAIRISQPANHRITLDIENNGTPLTPDTATRIFTPFFTTKPHGTGIGLSLSRRIITANRGTLNLTTPPSNPTTRLTLTLPTPTHQPIKLS
ncbi:ATP-binding protein [uncultured Duncaniella sp.]|uniref:sensor histidine kinase n=1 Tax=uncultured Duncaniella sp. TaxID=2768039 RepID=UPI00263B0821|nr:ATP-binding protein [uncultured Duncaniella sp.]